MVQMQSYEAADHFIKYTVVDQTHVLKGKLGKLLYTSFSSRSYFDQTL